MARRFANIAEVYRHISGAAPFTREYMDWCEKKVHAWQDFLRSEGQEVQSNFTYIRPDGSRQSYIDWLIQNEGV